MAYLRLRGENLVSWLPIASRVGKRNPGFGLVSFKMRAGASTVQQTLTPEAASILKHAVAEACRRGHGQATPLHVAATLLCAQASPLRRACLQTHPHASHLPQCRGLELCFSIALERMQAAQGPLPGGQPSYSNALVAALKRAQAQQRRGCPEQQQQPLLAVKVELEQLVISILDDPSVSRVMREAGFSSTDVKNHLEETGTLMTGHHSGPNGSTDHARLSWGGAIDQIGLRLSSAPSLPVKFSLSHSLPHFNCLALERNDTHLRLRPAKTASVYLNPSLQTSSCVESFLSGGSDSKRVLEVLLKRRRRNPVLVGDSKVSLEAVLRDLMHRMERRDVPAQLQGAKFYHARFSCESLRSVSKEVMEENFVELNNAVKELMPGGAIIYLGDLQWLLDTSKSSGWVPRPLGFCPVRYATTEMTQLLNQHSGSGRLWLVGLATSDTYLGCQVHHPTLESQWDLQPLLIGSSGVGHSLPSRYTSQEAGVNSMDSVLTLSLKASPTAALKQNLGNEDGAEKLSCCSDCKAKYEKEALLLYEQGRQGEAESPPSCFSASEILTKTIENEHSVHPANTTQTGLPLWLQKALPANSINKSESTKDKTLPQNQKLQDMQKKWNQTCRSLHVHHPPSLNISSEKLQQTSPPSSQLCGGNLARYQDQTISITRDDLNMSASVRPAISLFPTGSDCCPPCGSPGSSHSMHLLKNDLSDHLQQRDAHKERVHDSANCSPSSNGLTWQVPPIAALTMPSTEAATPSVAPKHNGCPPRFLRQMDPDAFKHLCKGLAERVSWQKGVISMIANTVMECRSGLKKRSGVSLKGDAWLLFLGYDKAGKKLMAEALAELIFGCEKKPICMKFGCHQDLSSPSTWSLGVLEPSMPSRGKLPLERLAEAMRQNPFSLVFLEDVDKADLILKSALLRAMEKGRLSLSSGREVSFSNAIVVMTSSVGTDSCVVGNLESKVQVAEGRFAINTEGTFQCSVENTKIDVDNFHLRVHPGVEQHSSSLAHKRKVEWNVDDETEIMSVGNVNKRTNLGQALALDLNVCAEESEIVDSSGCGTAHNLWEDTQSKFEISGEQVLLGARKHLKEFCDLADATVIFHPV